MSKLQYNAVCISEIFNSKPKICTLCCVSWGKNEITTVIKFDPLGNKECVADLFATHQLSIKFVETESGEWLTAYLKNITDFSLDSDQKNPIKLWIQTVSSKDMPELDEASTAGLCTSRRRWTDFWFSQHEEWTGKRVGRAKQKCFCCSYWMTEDAVKE